MASIKAVADILRMPARVTAHGEALNAETLKDFTEQWKTLPEKDKEELKAGVADGSMNY